MSEKSSASDNDGATPKRRPPLRLIVAAVLGVLTLILVLQNTESVETRILLATVTMPRAVLLLITFLLGVVVGLLAAFLRKRSVGK